VENVKDLILSETNIKNIEYIKDTSGILRKKIKPNFKALGPKVGKNMKTIAAAITGLNADQIQQLENNGEYQLPEYDFTLSLSDVEISAEDVEGWQVANLGKLSVALDVQITPELKQEGISREVVNRIQNLRKEMGFEVTDKIIVKLNALSEITDAVNNNISYIRTEILANSLDFVKDLADGEKITINEQEINILIERA
ncbi:MAG TPA: DUF5915 domain-containing protein, partial [Sphingobacteriaceae bacterium]|nr:DUF5915 domain-containing protein [Sphingobacteriaceae bacterium]